MLNKHDKNFVKSQSRTAQSRGNNFGQRLIDAAVNLFENPWTAALSAGVIYLLVSVQKGAISHPTEVAYYNYLADAFLHGQTWLRLIPPSTHDLVFYGGKYFLYWAPFPAITLLPVIAVFGVSVNDVIYTLIIASMNVGLIAVLLRSAERVEFILIGRKKRAIMVFFFAFGTVHFILAPLGKVWMTGQLFGFTCTILAYLATFSLKGWKAWFFTGLALAAAMLTRTQMVFTGIFPLVYLFFREKPWNWRIIVRNLIYAAMPLFIALGFYMLYNNSRFQNPFDVGLAYQQMGSFIGSEFGKYGTFNIHYIPKNFYYHYFFYPFPMRDESFMGGSLFLLSPLFFAIFFVFRKPKPKYLIWALYLSILLTDIPILMLIGTGWIQFGPRYTLDFTVPLLLLVAIGIENWSSKVVLLLAGISVISYMVGFAYIG